MNFSQADLADCTDFMGGAASCRSIFIIFSHKLQALKARQNTVMRERGNGGNGNFFTQIPQIAQILWEDARLAYPILFSLCKPCCAEGTKIACDG